MFFGACLLVVAYLFHLFVEIRNVCCFSYWKRLWQVVIVADINTANDFGPTDTSVI